MSSRSQTYEDEAGDHIRRIREMLKFGALFKRIVLIALMTAFGAMLCSMCWRW